MWPLEKSALGWDSGDDQLKREEIMSPKYWKKYTVYHILESCLQKVKKWCYLVRRCQISVKYLLRRELTVSILFDSGSQRARQGQTGAGKSLVWTGAFA